MIVIAEALDGRVLDGPVHAFDLAIGPRMLWAGRAMIDNGLRTGALEGVSPEQFTSRHSLTADPPEPGAVNWLPLSVSTVCTL